MTWTAERVSFAVALVFTALVVAMVLAWAVLRAGKYPAPTMLVLAVSLLSITALIGGLVFDNDTSLAIASGGLGALAGAVSSTFTIQPRYQQDKEERFEHQHEEDGDDSAP